MKHTIRWQRIFILLLLSITFVSPILFFSFTNFTSSLARREFVEDIYRITYTTPDTLKHNAIQQEIEENLKKPGEIVYKDGDNNSLYSGKSSDNHFVNKNKGNAGKRDDPLARNVEHLRISYRRRGENQPNTVSIPSEGQRIKTIEAALSKAREAYSDCSSVATKLRAMIENTEAQIQAEKNQTMYLMQLAARTSPKGLHCLSMRLTADYYTLQPEEREFPNKLKLLQLDLFHYAVFSDNVLACAVVVNSTVSSSVEPKKIVFHIVTDALSLPAMTMWFLANPPGEATIQVKSIDDFKWLPSSYSLVLKQPNSQDPRYTSALEHLRFYLPEVFPMLDKVVLLDHDVVVQRDLRGLWTVDMKGKVNGAVETCSDSESYYQIAMFLNFTVPAMARGLDVSICKWAFGMNVFDLQEWRRQNLTTAYDKWFQSGNWRQLREGGSMPLSLITFYNHTVSLDPQWHVLGLGYDPGIMQGEIEKAAVIHYDESLKPWLEIGIGKYRSYWNKYVPYNHRYLRQCNIHKQ